MSGEERESSLQEVRDMLCSFYGVTVTDGLDPDGAPFTVADTVKALIDGEHEARERAEEERDKAKDALQKVHDILTQTELSRLTAESRLRDLESDEAVERVMKAVDGKTGGAMGEDALRFYATVVRDALLGGGERARK